MDALGSGFTRRLVLGFVVLFLSACASRPYQGVEVDAAAFIQRGIIQQAGGIRVTAAVPDAKETIDLVGLDLYDQGIQPVWLEVENGTESRARIATWSIDRDYFSPIEVAYMNRKGFSKAGYGDMERWFYENGMEREIPAGETRAGLVFTNLRRGTKGFNLLVFNGTNSQDFTFFVPLPGFVPDFMEVDFENLYLPSELRDLDADALRQVLEEELACCTTDSSGELPGAPLNVTLVGSGLGVRRAMLRGGWLETSAENVVAARARDQHFQGRPPDAIFSQLRLDGNERIQLHLWMAPWLIEGEPVWVGQVFYFTEGSSLLGLASDGALRDNRFISFYIKESVTADIDSAQRFLFQNLWYNGSMRLGGYVGGVGHIPMDEPYVGFGGNAYFTEGARLLVFLSEQPMAVDEVRFIYPDSVGVGQK